MKTLARLCMIPVVLFTLSGCEAIVLGGLGAVLGAGGYHYYQGELKAELNARLLDVWDASKKAIEQMGYAVEDSKQKGTEAKLKATKPNEEPVTIAMKYVTYDKSEIFIRVGVFGDKERSVSILEKIKANLHLR